MVRPQEVVEALGDFVSVTAASPVVEPSPYVPSPVPEILPPVPVREKKRLEDWHPAELKSCAQKCVRRGLIGESCATVRALATRDPIAAIRRLPIVAAEDCGWRSLGPCAHACRRAQELVADGRTTVAVEVLVTAAGELAARAKNRDCAALFSAARSVFPEPVVVIGQDWVPRLIEALCDRDEVKAAKFALQVAGKRATRRAFWSALRSVAALRSTEAFATVEAAAERLEAGTRDADIGVLCGAAIVATCRAGNGMSIDPPRVVEAWDREAHLERPPWFAFDSHTRVGCRAIGRLVKAGKSMGLTDRQVSGVMFYVSSISVDRLDEPHRYFRFALEHEIQELVRIKGGTAEAEKFWEILRPDVEAAILKELEW